MKLIDLVATIQTHVDQGISTILYMFRNFNVNFQDYMYMHTIKALNLYTIHNIKCGRMYKLCDLID